MAVLPTNFVQPGRVLQARDLHQDAILPLTLDQRLDSAEFVDAAFDDLDRLFDGLPDAIGDRGLRNGQSDDAAAGIADLKAALAAGAEQAAHRLRQLAQLGQRGLQFGIPGNANLDAVALRG